MPFSGSHASKAASPFVRLGEVVLDAEGMVRAVEQPVARYLGHEAVQLRGGFFFAYVHAQDLARMLREAAALLQGRSEAVAWTFRFRNGEGGWSWVRALARRRGANEIEMALSCRAVVPEATVPEEASMIEILYRSFALW